VQLPGLILWTCLEINYCKPEWILRKEKLWNKLTNEDEWNKLIIVQFGWKVVMESYDMRLRHKSEGLSYLPPHYHFPHGRIPEVPLSRNPHNLSQNNCNSFSNSSSSSSCIGNRGRNNCEGSSSSSSGGGLVNTVTTSPPGLPPPTQHHCGNANCLRDCSGNRDSGNHRSSECQSTFVSPVVPHSSLKMTSVIVENFSSLAVTSQSNQTNHNQPQTNGEYDHT